MKLKLKMSIKILTTIKFNLSNSTKLKYYDNSNKLMVDKIKDQTAWSCDLRIC